MGVQPDDAPFLLTNRDRVIAVALGATCGFVVGLTSVGSGTFFGLIMVMVFPLTVAKIVGTDIFQAALLLWVAGFGHLVAGNVDLHAMAWLLLVSIPGVLLTSQFTLKLPDRALRLAWPRYDAERDQAGRPPDADWVIAVGAVMARLAFATGPDDALGDPRPNRQALLALDHQIGEQAEDELPPSLRQLQAILP